MNLSVKPSESEYATTWYIGVSHIHRYPHPQGRLPVPPPPLPVHVYERKMGWTTKISLMAPPWSKYGLLMIACRKSGWNQGKISGTGGGHMILKTEKILGDIDIKNITVSPLNNYACIWHAHWGAMEDKPNRTRSKGGCVNLHFSPRSGQAGSENLKFV